MNNEDFESSSPEALELEAESTPRKVNIRDYYKTVSILRGKGFSFADIAEWLSKRVGVDITRSQISYLLTTPSQILAEDEEQEEMEARAEHEEEHGR